MSEYDLKEMIRYFESQSPKSCCDCEHYESASTCPTLSRCLYYKRAVKLVKEELQRMKNENKERKPIEDLKPKLCPFCGKIPEVEIPSNFQYNSGEYYIKCSIGCKYCKVCFNSKTIFTIHNGHVIVKNDGYNDMIKNGIQEVVN